MSTGRTLDEIAKERDRVWSSSSAKRTGRTHRESIDPASLSGVVRKTMPSRLAPQLATLVSRAPAGEEWMHEVKYDGYRILAFKRGGRVRLVTRNCQDWTPRFPGVAEAVRKAKARELILDGEVVVLRDGATDFQALQNSIDSHVAGHVYFCFDLPFYGGYDLTAVPLLERKAFLGRVLAGQGFDTSRVRYSEHVIGRGEEFHRSACKLRLEGIVSKRADAPYECRRTRTWLKVKCLLRQEFVVGGWSAPAGRRTHFGALLLGIYDGDALVYCGRVGTGFTERSLADLAARLSRLERATPPFAGAPRGRDAKGVRWVEPKLVVEVAFTEWTADGILRHPSFQGIREDRQPRSVHRERAQQIRDASPPEVGSKTVTASREPPAQRGVRNRGSKASRERNRTAAARTQAGGSGTVEVAGVRITHPERSVFPDRNITKGDLARYYETIADWILPHVVGRPLTLLRCPEGQAGECFYQRHVREMVGEHVRAVPVEEKGKRRLYLAVDDLAGLMTLVQLNALEFHTWGCRADRLERPDRIVIDLDPDTAVPWDSVVQTARAFRERLERLDLACFVRTTGGKGLHVVLPIERRSTWAEAKELARLLALDVARSDPSLYVLTAARAKRSGRIYLDYLRNAYAASAVASYSTRARAGAPVATPITWTELGTKLDPTRFDVHTVPRRFATLTRDPWEGFFDCRQSVAIALRTLQGKRK